MNPTLNIPQAPTPRVSGGSKQDVKKVVILVIVLFVGLAIALGGYLITRPQTVQNRASENISCPVEGASCEWDAAALPAGVAAGDESSYQESQTYNYTIIDKTTGKTIKTGTTKATKVTFTPVLNHTYVCKVVTVSKCGVCDEQSAEGTCSAFISPTVSPSPTPSSSPTPTVSPTASPTPNPKCGSTCQTDAQCPNQHVCRSEKCVLDKCAQPGVVCTDDKCSVIPPTATPTSTPTSTPTLTPSPTLTLTPTVTNTPVPQATATRTPTPTEVVVAQSNPTEVPQATAVPTIPSAGSSSGVYFMVVAGIVLASLLLVF